MKNRRFGHPELMLVLIGLGYGCVSAHPTAALEHEELVGNRGHSTVSLQSLRPPQFFRAGGSSHLVHELVFEVLPSAPTGLRLESVVVHDSRPRTFTGEDLEALAVELIGDATRVSGLRRLPLKGRLGPGHRGALYLWSSIPTTEELPLELAVEMRFSGMDAPLRRRIAVDPTPPPTLTSPVTGPGWFTFMAPTNASSHRRSIHEAEGSLYLAQRYAIDLVRTDEEGRRITGEPSKNESYLSFGTPIVAVADGVVSAVRTDLPDNQPGACTDRAVAPQRCKIRSALPMTRETLAGNYVVQELSDGLYAVYAHLLSGSVEVVVGDRVTRGQALGRLGNSGNSSEPHLHFHVCDSPGITVCRGVPFHFERFVEIPIDPRRGPTGPPRMVEGELPVDSAMIHFPDETGALLTGP